LNQLQLSKIVFEFYSNTDRIRRSIYEYSFQLYLLYLVAAQSLCEKRGPNKKDGGHNVWFQGAEGIGGCRHPVGIERIGAGGR
jgi:hypothetical protein